MLVLVFPRPVKSGVRRGTGKKEPQGPGAKSEEGGLIGRHSEKRTPYQGIEWAVQADGPMITANGRPDRMTNDL